MGQNGCPAIGAPHIRMADLDYQEIINRRRALVIEPYKSLAEVGFDGSWVTPYQIISKSFEGPVLVALHWLDESSILRERVTLRELGYLPNIRFNSVIDDALKLQGLSRSDIYVTQTFHLVPHHRSEGNRTGRYCGGAMRPAQHRARCGLSSKPARIYQRKECDRDRWRDRCAGFWESCLSIFE
jgi:hypothetical protein